MKKFSLIIVAILFLTPAFANAIIGLGVKGGLSKDINGGSYDQGMTDLGLDVRTSVLPKIDLIGSVEYSWKKYKVSNEIPIEGTVHFLSITGSAVFPLKMPVVSPYAGLGYGYHVIGGSVDAFSAGGTMNGTGLHFLAGVKFGPPASPLSIYGEYRHYWTNFDSGNRRYYTLTAGIMFGAL